MNKLESIQENEIHKILWDFDIQTDQLIPARRPDLVLKNLSSRRFYCSNGQQSENAK